MATQSSLSLEPMVKETTVEANGVVKKDSRPPTDTFVDASDHLDGSNGKPLLKNTPVSDEDISTAKVHK